MIGGIVLDRVVYQHPVVGAPSTFKRLSPPPKKWRARRPIRHSAVTSGP